MTKTGHRKKASERKEEIVPVKVTSEQKQAFVAAADKLGLGVSVWLRQLGMQALAAAERSAP
jgi:hypothetical protein